MQLENLKDFKEWDFGKWITSGQVEVGKGTGQLL